MVQSLILTLAILLSSYSFAAIRLTGGPEGWDPNNPAHPNQTHIDTALGRANLHVEYMGCDEKLNPANIELIADPQCKEKTTYKRENGEVPEQFHRGEILIKYTDDNKTCEKKRRYRTMINTSLRSVFNDFVKMGCKPSHLLVKDGDGPSPNVVQQSMTNKGLCNIQKAKIVKPGFPTEKYPQFEMKADDKEFSLGKTNFKYNHISGSWCVSYEDTKQCRQPQDWVGPIPMIRSNGGKRYVDMVVHLQANGKAVVKATKGLSYDSRDDVFKAMRDGSFYNSDEKQGRIEFETRRDDNGLIRSVVRTFDQDTPNAPQRRAVNFFARNVFGMGITNNWCKDEHCFIGVTNTKLATSRCSDNPKINMNNGGSGNVCASCIGYTPGQCAIGHPLANKNSKRGEIGQANVTYVQTKLKQNDRFKIMNSGEYKYGEYVEEGVLMNFQRMIAKPEYPGCHAGFAPAFRNIFDPETPFMENEESDTVVDASKANEKRKVSSEKNKKSKKDK